MTFQQFEEVGYKLKTNVKDVMGVSHKYGLYPQNSGGINYFENMKDIDIWYREVLVIRAIQNGEYDLAERSTNILNAKKLGISIVKYMESIGQPLI